jgi:hypothetical protein
MNKKKGQLVKMGEEKPDIVFNKVWEITCMTWPAPVPEKMDRSKVKLIRAG